MKTNVARSMDITFRSRSTSLIKNGEIATLWRRPDQTSPAIFFIRKSNTQRDRSTKRVANNNGGRCRSLLRAWLTSVSKSDVDGIVSSPSPWQVYEDNRSFRN